MLAIIVPHCRGCGTPVPPKTSGRRLLAGHSSGKILNVEGLARRKLNDLKMSVDVEASRSGFVCRKCFRCFQSYADSKNKLLQALEEAIKHMPTCGKEGAQTTRVSLLGKHKIYPRSSTTQVEGETAVKRPRVQYFSTSSSPDVQVRC